VLPHPALEALAERDESHPLVRFVCALALHAFELHAGLIEGPFDQARAERYAREPLMPADAFAPLASLTDVELAALLGVPVEEVGGQGGLSSRGDRLPTSPRRKHSFPRARARARNQRERQERM
jgi:hypothetical protein